jgi:glycerate 2-kinase
VNLMVVDEVAGLPWGPSVPDATTFGDCVRVLKKYGLWGRVLDSVRRHLVEGLSDLTMETLKPKDFERFRVHNVILADNQMVCRAAEERAGQLGLRSLVLTTVLEGESREAGVVLATIGREVEARGRPVEAPCVLICGGETNVRIVGKCGLGGPSQEFVLGASLKLDGSERAVVASVDTDGTDGPTDVAGGVVDGYTLRRGRLGGFDIYGSLMRHDSYAVLRGLKDAILMGATETNVMDLDVVVVL